MKKAVVTKVVPFLKGGQQTTDDYGNFTFTLTFDNNDCGYYSTKSKEAEPFIVGQEAEYEIEEKEGKGGKSYFKIKRPQQNKGAWTGGGGKSTYIPKDPAQIKKETQLNARSMLMRYAVDLWIADKIERKDIKEVYEQIVSIYDDSISDITLG